jgi:hypothetical protein
LLAFCNMRTLYLRNVPDEVVSRLELLAERERMSLSAFAVRELTQTSARADNVRLLAELPVLEVDRSDVLDVIDEGRAAR